MGKGKAPKGRKVKVASKLGKKGAATMPTSVSVEHDKKAGRVPDVAPTAAPPAVGQDVAGAKVVGFTNLGNTCFFNSVLQVLVASPPLQHFFSQANAKVHQGPLGGAMQEVFDQLHAEPEGAAVRSKDEDKPSKAKKQKQRGCYAPQRLLTAVCKVAPHFKGFQQQDSHEMLRVLLDGLQTEEAKAIAARLKCERPQKAEEEAESANPKGFLSEVFEGQLSSKVACEVCHHTSVTLEPFMDLSLPIPAGALADMGDSTPDRKGKKAPKGKISRKGEADSAGASSPALHADAQPGTRLKPKQKKKLLKEERKASKLERKKQAKAESAGSASQASAANSDSATPSSFASVSPPEATNSPVAVAQPSQTDCAWDEPAQAAESTDSGMIAKGNGRSDNTGDASDQIEAADQGLETQQNGQHPQLSVNTHKSQVEPAEPHDVLQEIESLSPMLPDMPRLDKGDDLAGLFQAAFATCHKELSPRGRSPQSRFSSHGQDQDKEDFSLYNDADEVMGDNEVQGAALDASDEEQEGKQGEVTGTLLESFMRDAEHAAHLQASPHSAQAEQEDEACTNIGNLFDESITEAADSANFQDFGAADEADLTDEQATTSGEAKLQSCLAEFFQQEQITWECPAEKKVKRELRRNSLGSESSPATPAHQKRDHQANGKLEFRHTVSFSEENPVVTLIPGSVEQRGQVFRTSHGDPPFCRPLRLDAAFVLLTTAPDVRRPTRMHIKIQPQDDEEATLMLASNIRHLATADVPAPKVGDDEEEVRLAQAQVLMDCLADLLSQKGLEGTHAWCEKGLKLRCRSSGETSSWIVFGRLPEEEGEGQWEYPSPTDPSHHTCNEMDLVASQELPTPSSCSSSQSDSSSTADQQDSANLDSMLGMISSQRHTNNSQEPSSNSAQTHTGPLEPEQGSITVTEAAPTDGETTEGSSTAMGETGTDTADSQIPQLQQIEDSNSADDTDGGASSSSPPGHAPSKPASSPKDLAACEAGSACGSAEDADGPAGFRSSAAQPSPADLQQSEQASATAPAAALEGDKPPQASCSEQIRCDDGKHGEGQSGTINGVDSASCQSSASGKEQSQQSEHGNGSAEVDGKAPKTPIRKAPKKGGLVNVQRPAVKGYSIHRCPPLLTVHVKRFQQDMRGRLSKIDGAVPFPINLNLTPFCDPKGPDAGGATYTLLGFVEHLGTMRSGHYVAYVQRGMDVSQSPHLQSLLQKHGLAPASALGSQTSSSVSPAVGKKQKKVSKAGLAAPSADRGAMSKLSSAADGTAAARQSTAASGAAATNSAGAGSDGEKSQASSTLHMNGKVGEQQSIPDDWDSTGTRSTDNSNLGTPSGPDDVVQPSVSRQPTDTSSAEAGTAAAVASVGSLTTSTDGPALGQPTPSAKEPDTAQLRSRHENAATDNKQLAEQRSWFYISDTQVKAVSEADILRREAYILLYMRTG